tara:strand:+ start:38 stop:1669 length:1632 start_codon:yes stop_codon:yes gene_type:complete
LNNNIWYNYFPYQKPREQQKRVIEKVLEEFKNGKKYAIVDCGTGVGKSAIGLTIARTIINSSEFDGNYQNGSYFLTTQKILQNQYEKDFSKTSGLISLYSSSNYTCKNDKNTCCKEIQAGLRANSLPKKFNSCSYDCVYKKKKKDFIEKDLGITNFSYFLTEKNYSQKVPNKRVLVIDEAHNLENELTRFVEISISSYFANKILKLKIPSNLNTQFKVYKWIKEIYYPAVQKKCEFIKTQLTKFGITSNKLDEFQKITKNFDMLSGHEKKILQFITLYDKDNWVFDIEQKQKDNKRFIFKPIDVSNYAAQYLLDYADYIIFMSATIISHEGFSLTLGLPFDKTISIKEDSPFPEENRPIIFSSCGSMSFKNIEKTLPVIVQAVDSILENHKNEKGIIHTHSIKIAESILKKLSKKYKNRLLIAYGKDRDEILKKHINSKNPTVLLSPSMAEGVDLKGNLSSFQIICKIPFPYLGDKVIKKKMSKWNWWYDTQTVRTIIQSVGRSIRSEKDTAVTYILDDDWKRLKSKARNYFPESFFKNYHEY